MVLRIHVHLEFASAAQMTPVAIQARLVIPELVSVEQLLRVLDKQLDLIAMRPTTFASAHRR